MTTLAVNNSCLATTASRKRKRNSELHVRFCTQPQSIVYTWSQSDYDRSGLFPAAEETTMQKEDCPTTPQFILTLSINIIQPQQPLVEEQQQHQPIFKKKSKLNRPKLSIDTSKLHGPLYFTNMTTNHQKKKREEEEEAIVVEEDPIDLVTKENTRRNGLPLLSC